MIPRSKFGRDPTVRDRVIRAILQHDANARYRVGSLALIMGAERRAIQHVLYDHPDVFVRVGRATFKLREGYRDYDLREESTERLDQASGGST